MSFFTALGRWAIGAADNVVDEVIDIIGRRAGDDLVDIPDAIDDDFEDYGALENLGQENAERIRMETQGPLQEVNPTFQAEPQITDDIVDADFEDIDIANAEADAADAQSINIALRDNPIFQNPQVRQSVEQFRAGGSSNFQIRNYLDVVKREYEDAGRPVTRAIDAQNTEQLRELYGRYKLPIPKTNAEALAAELIMEADRGVSIGASSRRNIDLNYLKAHAPDDVYKKHGPTILEAKLAQQASVVPPLRTDKSRSGLPFYSAAARAAENLKVPSGSYEKLKKLALKQGGVKAKEFEWSGADEAFEGRTDVTPTELAEYLKQNSNLIREEQKMATGIMRDASSGGYDDGIDGFLDSQDGQAYINDYLEMFEENFKNDFTYNTNMNKISDLNSKSLDEIAEEIDGVSSGRELAEKYPDGWVATDAYYNTGFKAKVFGSDEAAADWEWRENADSYDQAAREGAENNLNEMRVYDTDNFNMTVFGSDAPVADPADLEYANYFPSGGTDMTETRYVFDDPTGDLPEGYFKAGHFDDDENVVAHARAGEFPVETGGTAYHLGEAQSDVQQAARKAAGPTRTREQELFKDNYDSVKDLFRQYVVGAENDLSHKVFGGGIGRSNTRFRDNPEALAEYKTIVADFFNSLKSARTDRTFVKLQPENIRDDHSFFEGSQGSTTELNDKLNQFAEYIQENKDKLPEPYTAWADVHTGLSMPNIQKQSDELKKLEASGINVEDTTVGAPMLESTDAWLDMVLRSQLSDAIASGADYLTLPNPQMVKDYTGGDFEGHRQFYGNIAPKNLMNVVKPADPTADFVPIKIKTGKQPEDVLGLPLTQDLITGLRKMGLPKYVVPFGGVGYGALGAMAEDEETAAGGGL